MTSHPFGIVFSDLHICSPTSIFDRYRDDFERACSSHSLVVLNGDTFDFKRSRLRTHAETVAFGLEWVKALLQRHPQTRFEYIIGNHDCTPSLLEGLHAIAALNPQLRVHYTLLELGTNLFLHGDACDLPDGISDIDVVRDRYRAGLRSASSIFFGELVTRLRLNIVEYYRHPQETLARRLLEYLDVADPGIRQRVSTIYFGHTHAAFQGFRYEGITFHNTGCALRGLTFAPAKFEAR